MSDLQDAIAGAFNSLQDVAGVAVKYSRGSDWTRCCAVPGRTDFPVDDGNGVITEYRSRDYLIEARDLYFGQTAFTPQRGDLIEEEVGSQRYVYEVLRPDGGEQVWRYTSSGHSVVRVHTKLKSAVAI